MDINEKIKRCLARHPDWEDRRIASATGGRFAAIEAIRRGEMVPVAIPRLESPIGPALPPPTSAPAAVSLAAVKERFDTAAAITRALSNVQRGTLLPQDELCRLTVGRDRNRFRRAIDNNPDLVRAHRVRLCLDDSTEGKFYWGHEADVQEAARLRDM